MANKEILTIDVNSKNIRAAIKKNGSSIRSLAKAIGFDDSTLRYWLHDGRMAPNLVWKICGELHLCPKDVIQGNTLWMRIGVTVPVTDEELDWLLQESREGSYSGTSFEDVDLDGSVAGDFLQRAVADGETYIPGCCFDEYEELFNK